jgi:phosphohistidine phosphatase
MSDVVVVRHAIAMEREEAAQSGLADEQRPLTPEGRKKMRRVAAGLHTLVPEIGVLASSPLLRAIQTAELIEKEYRGPSAIVTEALAPGAVRETLLEWMQQHCAGDLLVIVGHEPGVSDCVSWLLAGESRPFLQLKKGAACLLRFPGAPEVAAATLMWALTPRQLRTLRD